MKDTKPNIDGFALRRRAQGDNLHPRPTLDGARHPALPQQFAISAAKSKAGQDYAIPKRPSTIAGGADGSFALPKPDRDRLHLNLTLDDDQQGKKRRKKRLGKLYWRRKKIIKWAAIAMAVILVAVAGYFAYKFFATSSKVFDGNVLTALFNEGRPLKTDINGRSNVLVFGTSREEEGHDGADLTDSIMIISVNQEKHEAFMLSVPRDLYVNYDPSCPASSRGRINAIYSCVLYATNDERAAQDALRAKLSEVFGLDIQYTVHIHDSALRQAVDAVGGITVNIDSEDPRGILDRNFDWDCPGGLFTCYNVQYPNGPAQLDGKRALYLARARGANGITYGLPQANFDREKYQRAILIALRDKAVSVGTLANPVALNSLLDALGENVRSNFDAEEIKTLAKIAQDIGGDKIRALVLNDAEDPLVTTGQADGQSIVQPVGGLYDYSNIHAAVEAYATNNLAAIEKAAIDVLNASGEAGKAQTTADQLEAEKLIINAVGNAPETLGGQPISLYDLSGGQKPETLKKLESVLGIKVTEGVPAGVNSNADFVVIVGRAATETE